MVAGTVNTYSNVKMIVRGSPQYLDPQLAKGSLRFAQVVGSNFSGLQPANRYALTETVMSGTTTLTLADRPSWYQIGCLIRIGLNEQVGELQLIQDLVYPTSLDTSAQLVNTYTVGDTAAYIPQVSLIGTPCNFFDVAEGRLQRRTLFVESWYPMVPGDIILASPSPESLASLTESTLSYVNLMGTRAGIGYEPATIYQYECQISSGSGLLPFAPTQNLTCYLKAQPMFQRMDYASGDIQLDNTLGPCLVDAFYGSLLYNQKTTTVLGIKTYDVFGNQTNIAASGNQQWQQIPSNYVLMQRPIISQTFLLWQRLQGQFQLIQTGNIFQAQLDSNGQFVMSSDMLVPAWSSATQNGWVVPIMSEGPITLTVQFMPQALQVFTIPANTLTLIRPTIYADPNQVPINRIVIAMQGSPNSLVKMRDWSYNGSVVNSLSYYILGSGAAFGLDRWLAGGFCVKPVFLNLDVLKASYSDGISSYDSGYIYS